ncbi:hypothetical protein Tco_0936875 [Tanacetum coccineum]|uniref:Uncharacterized protein n=1 Tax=Tanacetum coccineum TaxID=301880 RepID=A0ABQ5DCL7_9ASTR
MIEVIPDKEEVAVDAIPLATKPLSIVDWKIIKEGKIVYYQIIRAYGISNRRYGLGLILYMAPCAIKGVFRKNTKNLNNKIIKLNEELSDCETDLYNYKRGLSQVEARLVEFRNNEIKFCKRIRVLERDLELRDNKIENLRNELKEVKKEKESIDFKIENFDNASKDLDCLLGTQRSVKDKTGLGLNEYTAVPPPPAQVYSPPKNDLSWTGLPGFVDDTVTDYSRPTPSIDVLKDVSDEQKAIWKSNSVSFSEQRGSVGNVLSKPMISFVKETGCPSVSKMDAQTQGRHEHDQEFDAVITTVGTEVDDIAAET